MSNKKKGLKMTRKEAKKLYMENSDKMPLEQKSPFEIINKIYDDIENRVCVNCAFCDFDVENKQTVSKGYCNELLHIVHLNFGCNRFKN